MTAVILYSASIERTAFRLVVKPMVALITSTQTMAMLSAMSPDRAETTAAAPSSQTISPRNWSTSSDTQPRRAFRVS